MTEEVNPPRDDSWSEEAVAWNAEYSGGRYEKEAPVPFVDDILKVARERQLIGAEGIYIGCGNGRNYVPLVLGGLDLIGLDISGVAIEQLAQSVPDRRNRLIHGSLDSLPSEATYPIVIGIQVFQHGDERRAHQHIRDAQSRITPGGLFCVRVNAQATELEFEHEITERNRYGGFTARYLAGPKAGLDVHFFALQELATLFDGFEPVLTPTLSTTWRQPPAIGQWSQWEAIWKKPTTPPY